MTSFLHSKNKNFELSYMKKTFIVGFLYFFLFSILALLNNVYYLFLINLILSCSFILMFSILRLRFFNICLIHIFFVVIIYTFSSVYFFGFNLGFEYFLLPIITYSHLLNFDKLYKSIAATLSGLICFYILLYLFYANDYSLNMPLRLFSYDISNYFYMLQIAFVGSIFTTASYAIRRMRKEEINAKKYLNKELDKNISMDYLTGLKNRSFFIDYIEDMNGSKEVNLALIDIDFFKKINDAYGHNRGDEVLKICANLIKKHFKDLDALFCRWGGEEFLVFARNVKQIDFLKTCENFRRDFEKIDCEIEELKVTVSIGAIYINDVFLSSLIDEYIKQTDECLLSAKSNGRNRISKNSI